MLTKEEYEKKRNTRYEKLLAAAQKAESEGKRSLETGKQMFSVIPFGQPILVGHYSEKSDRNYRERARNKITKGYELYQKAEEYRIRAASIERNDAVYSDDPEATEKLEDKIARLEKRQQFMKDVNKLVRKGDREGVLKLTKSETVTAKLFIPDFCGRIGFADFEIKNNNANIRRLKERAAIVSKRQSMDDKTEEINGIKVEFSPSENLIRLDYGARVDRETFIELRRHGFRATKTEGQFSAYYNNSALYFVKIYIRKDSQ